MLARNAIALSLEGKAKLAALRADAFPQIRHWGVAGIKSGQGADVFYAVFLRAIDGFSKKLGVTGTLQKLSGNRFCT